MEHGMRPDMPAALVRWGTTARHQSWVSTVGEIAALAEAEGIKAPSMLVVGEVELRDRLNWFEQLPLHGRGVVVTRAREQASGLKDTLERLGAACYEFPTITIRPLDDYALVREAIGRLSGYDWLIFITASLPFSAWTRETFIFFRKSSTTRLLASTSSTSSTFFICF